MKQFTRFAFALIATFACAMSCYDDSSLVERVDDLEKRMAALEKEANTHAQQIATLLSGDYITDVITNGDGSYTIKFANHADITVKDGDKGETGAQGPQGVQGPAGEQGKPGENGKPGADGKDGVTPVISVGQDTDGNWYWKLNGEWLLDENGNKVRANGIDGSNGSDGKPGSDGNPGTDGETPDISVAKGEDGNWYWKVNGEWLLDDEGNKVRANGIDGNNGENGSNGATPKFKVEDDHWYVSYDEGKTWERLGPAVWSGEGGVIGADGKDGVTPQLKIEDGYWYVSLDEGKTWTRAGKATGADGKNGKDGKDGKDGDSFFKSIDVDNPDYVTFTLADGAQFQVPRYVTFRLGNVEGADNPAVISIPCGETVNIPIILPSGLTEAAFSAIKAKIEYSGGSVVDVATKASGDGWALSVNAPTFAAGKCNADASVSVTAPSEESGNLLLEMTLVLSDGAVHNTAKVIRSIEGEGEDPNAPVLSYEIRNVGCYTLEVECVPGSKCQSYAATIISIGKESPYLKGGKIDYDKMTQDVLDQFKISLNPPQYGVQPYLVSTKAHTYTVRDLYKNSVNTSSECRGYESYYPGNGPFAVLVATLDKQGNYEVKYEEVEVPKVNDNKNPSLVATISNVTSGLDNVSARIDAPGAAQVITYCVYSEKDETPTFSDDEKQGMPMPYDGPFTFVETKLSPVSHYYIVAIPIDASGKIGEPVLASVYTKDYEAKASGRIVSASFAAQTEVDRLNLTMSVTSNARKVRVIATHPDAFLGSYSSVIEGLINSYFRAYQEIDVTDPSSVFAELEIFKVGGKVSETWVVWGCIVDENGEISTPQNIATLADPSRTSWPLQSEINVSFNSSGTITPSIGQRTSPDKLPISFSVTDSVRRVRIYKETAFMYGIWVDDESFETLLSDPSEYRDNWTDVNVAGGSAEAILDVKAGESYVLLACGIDADGKFTRPVNIAASVAGLSNDATATYVHQSPESTIRYTVPYFYTVPQTR